MDFTIVEYDDSYAAQVADMWNRSGDSWGGYNVDFTEESVRQEEATSTAEARFLALVGTDVVGYISLLKWTEGEGALYVGVLNVRPDFHGKKIGKALLLKTIERTTELGWTRLDLHTWGGNTKAVPLYKRTGFFWEERDQEVYCVNFMPGVFQNELVSQFFDSADWYADSTRPVEVKPDGRKENELTYFTYSWKKGDRYLTMEYARKGRGLCGIDCNDFSVSARVENLNLVFGRSYTVRYRFENRTEEPLKIAIEGVDDKNIHFDFSYVDSVADTVEVDAEFFVGEIETPQSEWKTHPRVAADITINGKAVRFEVGVAPQFPARIVLKPSEEPLFQGVPAVAFIEIESKLQEEATIRVELPSSPVCTFHGHEIECSTAPKGRASVPVAFTPAGCGVYSQTLSCTAALESGATIEFGVEVGLRVPLLAGTYFGEMRHGDHDRVFTIGNGPYAVNVMVERDSHRNVVVLENQRTGRGGVVFFPPKLGKPFSEEFFQRRPDDITVTEEAGTVLLSLMFESREIPGAVLELFLRLFPTGMVERWFEVANASDATIEQELSVADAFRCDLPRVVLPYNGGVLETDTEMDANVWSWNSDQFTENWLFSRLDPGTAGFCWPENVRPQTLEWLLHLEHPIGVLEPHTSVRTETVTAFLDTFADWRELREYARRRRIRSAPPESSTRLIVNGGNPFVDGNCAVEVQENRQRHYDGVIRLSSKLGQFAGQSAAFAKEDKARVACFSCSGLEAPVDVLTAEVVGNVERSARTAVCFRSSDATVETKVSDESGHQIYTVSNGDLKIAAAPSFLPGLLRCTYRGTDWLDSTFPDVGPRDWWNPWVGGCLLKPSVVGEQALLRENTTATFAEHRDTNGLVWTGIRVTTEFTEHEELAGLAYDQYFLTTSGAPVVLQQTLIHQNTGKRFSRKQFETAMFVGTGDATDTVFSFRSAAGHRVEIGSGHEERTVTPAGAVTVRRLGTEEPNGEQRMLVYPAQAGSRCSVTTNKRSSLVTIGEPVVACTGESVWTAPVYLVFSDFQIEDESLRSLSDIGIDGSRWVNA